MPRAVLGSFVRSLFLDGCSDAPVAAKPVPCSRPAEGDLSVDSTAVHS